VNENQGPANGENFMKSLCLGCALALASTAAIAEGPSMTVGSRQMILSKADCIAKASSVMRSQGLTSSFEIVGINVFGEKGDYTGVIRCDANVPAVVFVVAGPESDQTIKIEGELETAFGSRLPN